MSFSLLLSLTLWVTPAQSGAPAVTPAARERAAALVRRLSDEAFAVREEAAAELRKLGPAAEEALRKGLTDADPEVRTGCQRLLTQLRNGGRETRMQEFLADPDKLRPALAGWTRFSAMAGTDLVARKRFAAIYRAEAALLEGVEKDPKSAAVTLAGRIAGLRVVFLTPSKDADVLRELTTLLYLAASGQVPLDAPAHGQFCAALNILAERSTLAKEVRADPLLVKLLRAYLIDRAAPVVLNQALNAALDLQLKDTLDWAVQTALAKDRPAHARGLAAILAGKVGGKAATGRLEPLLTDTTPVGTFKLGPTTLNTELRDVVLAVLIQTSGQKAEQYGFAYLQAVPGLKTLPSPDRLGFADAAARAAAFKKWQDAPATPKK